MDCTAKIALDSMQYGDVCKRSRSGTVWDAELQEFEKELLAAMEDAMNKES